MQLYIGDNIKRLRKQKGITQETLAERMNVSTAAVSKWERNETLPDISMVLPLASYFGVSTDELLGINAVKTEERIQEIINERKRLSALGKEHEAFDLVVQAYQEYPNDWRIVEEYMWQLNYDPIWRTGKDSTEVHKEELHRLCERVLDECTVDKVRYSALSVLGGLYGIDGQADKMIEIAKRFPNSYDTQGMHLADCYEEGSQEWWKQVRENTADYTDILMHRIYRSALKVSDPSESIRIMQKAIDLIELVCDEGDYGFWNYNLGDLYIRIAHRNVGIHNLDKAFENFEKGFQYAKAYDDLPKTSAHTSFLIRGNVFDKRKISSGTENNAVAENIEYLLDTNSYRELKDTPQMRALIAKYEPFAGKKKDYFIEE